MATWRSPIKLSVALFWLMACGGTPAEPREEPDLDVAGTWTVTVTEAGPSDYPYEAGSCSIDDFQITLRREGWEGEEFKYDGSHTGLRMVCVGKWRPATEVFDLPDSVVVVPPGSFSGWVRWGVGCWWACAFPEQWGFSMWFEDFWFYGIETSDGLEGDFNHRVFSVELNRIRGHFRAERS